MLILYIVRNLPSLPRRHFLLCWSSAPEAADEVPRDQDVLGEAPLSPGPGRVAGLQRAGRPGHGLCWDHLPGQQAESTLTTQNLILSPVSFVMIMTSVRLICLISQFSSLTLRSLFLTFGVFNKALSFLS